jgi:ADP-heptose:LPS heptosyltransferase
MDAGGCPRILFIRPDHVGDVLLTLPAVGALRRALPGAHLGYAAPPAAAAVAERCPHVDETLAVRFPTFGGRGGTWGATLCAGASRLAGRFDAALSSGPTIRGRASLWRRRRYRSVWGSTCRARGRT